MRARELVGRKIVSVDFGRFRDGRGGWATNPRITLDNGRVLYFVVEETEVGEYGVEMSLTGKSPGS